jgi:hypothetical protein
MGYKTEGRGKQVVGLGFAGNGRTTKADSIASEERRWGEGYLSKHSKV